MTVAADLEQVDKAVSADDLSPAAAENIRAWLTESRYAEYAPQVQVHIQQGKWQELDDAFWTIIPFGTGGRRGRMYPIGSNAINDRTIGESAQGLANYVKSQLGANAPLACAIAHDTRHRSEHFSRLCSEIMVAAGFKVYYLKGFRSTPELSFTVRYMNCSCGIMVTASHNPPSDNAVKAYWSTGGQLLPPHDQGVIDEVMSVQQIERVDFDKALAAGQIIECQEEVDREFIDAVVQLASPGPRDLKVVYSPLHGVGASAVSPVLEKAGFKDVELFALHAKPDGDFPNVPGHVSNPENPKVFDSIVEHAKKVGADLAVATDPDCDRIGCSAPLTAAKGSAWDTLTGNQIGALLADYVLQSRQSAGKITPESFIIITLVTTQLTRRIADSYGVQTFGDLLVGFKWIAGVIDEQGADNFLFGTEESHGYLAGQHVRDKDGAVGSLLLCELAAQLKAEGQTLHEKLDALYWQHGLHSERTVSVQMPGSEGMDRMKEVMLQFRSDPPRSLAGFAVRQMRNYLNLETALPDGSKEKLVGPQGDLVILDLEIEGNYVAIRPSGTEPKIKLYMFTYEPPEQLANLDRAKEMLNERLDKIEADMRAFAGV
ncbi:phospho-sugar mutase [Bythopirellula polymerisocia]|uniref:Phosphoglucomutase n=1 Tax=Bythopirellula polymerisocia TaxID=2528003 RepID=A0A5C6CXC9_9BACT|nr:phospho-sugar mutase [Bythopirellula polymerisocia]TWU28274.1 Phosphoglucomutase [Bythopirellula polymerisocia]